MAIEKKDPDAELDYCFTWADWLKGDVIISSEWIIPAGIIGGPKPESFTDTTTTIWLSGGTAKTKYKLTNRIATAGGRKNDRTMTVPVKER